MTNQSIAIVGGGLTGLVAALRLAEKGANVTVFEAGQELGGLAASFQMQGEPLEKAYHHLFITDVEILALIRELGMNDRLEWLESSLAIFRDGKAWPFMSPLDLLRFKPCSFFGRIRLGLVALHLKRRSKWEDLVKVPAIDWMRKACGNSATKAVWEPLLHGKFSDSAERISMAWLWARLHIRSNSREKGASREKLGYIRGGFIEIIKAMNSRLEARGVRIVLNARVEFVEEAGGRVAIHRDGGKETFDAALFTGSNRAFSRILPESQHLDDYKKALAQVHYLGAICMVFETDQKLGDFYWVNVNERDSPFLVMIRHTKLVPAERYGGKEIYYLGAYVPHDDRRFTLDTDPLRDEWFATLKKMHPEFEKEQVSQFHCFRFRDAQHVVDCDYESKLLPYEGPFPGLYLANFAQIFPQDRGTNFAVREGNKVAQEIEAALAAR